MTKREFYELIASNETLTADVRSFAQELIGKLDSSLEKRNSKVAEKKATENAPLFGAILDFLGSQTSVVVASEIASAVGISTQKASALLRQMVDSGSVVATEVKVKGGRSVKGFKVVPTDEVADEVEVEAE